MAAELAERLRALDPATIDITRKARASFRRHHPRQTSGPPGLWAEPQIRRLLRDMIASPRARVVPGRGYVRLYMSGYALVLAADLSAVTDYGTGHRERTWEDVKTGVPSATGRDSRRRRKARNRARRRAALAATAGPPDDQAPDAGESGEGAAVADWLAIP